MTLFDGSKKPFNYRLAYELYIIYLDTFDKIALEELTVQLIPLIRSVFYKDINKSIGECNFNVLQTEALEHLYFLLSDGKVPLDGSKKFYNYLWKTARHAMLNFITDVLYRQEFDTWYNASAIEIGYVECIEDVEIFIYNRQIRDLVYNACKADIKFNGKERKACVYLIECLLGYRNDIASEAAMHVFSINKPCFDYITKYARQLIVSTVDAVRQIEESE